MPLKWEDLTEGAPVNTGAFSFAPGRAPAYRATLWPHRSLPRKGFAFFILATYAMFLVPLFAVIGTKVMWGLLPFLLGALALIWYFLHRSYRSGELTEVLSIWSDKVELVRTNPDGSVQDWEANPHWVKVSLHPNGPVENYVTMRGNGREVEIGAFLSPEERLQLHDRLSRTLG